MKQFYSKILIDKTLGFAFGFVEIGSDKVILSTNYSEAMLGIEPLSVKKVEVKKEIPTLKMDDVLEKISTNGVDSLTDVEKSFLDLVSRGMLKG